MRNETATAEEVAEVFGSNDNVDHARVSHDEEVFVVYDGIHNCSIIRKVANMGWLLDSLSYGSDACHACFVPIGYKDAHENLSYESKDEFEKTMEVDEVDENTLDMPIEVAEKQSDSVSAYPYETQRIGDDMFRITYDRKWSIGSVIDEVEKLGFQCIHGNSYCDELIFKKE